MGKFDGSLESAVAAADKVLEDNPRSSGKQVREAVASLKVAIPSVDAVPHECRWGDGDSPEGLLVDGDRLNWAGDEYVALSVLQEALDGLGEHIAALAAVRQDLAANQSELAEARNEVTDLRAALGTAPVVEDMPGSQALREAADLLDLKPNVVTTNHKVAKWLRSK